MPTITKARARAQQEQQQQARHAVRQANRQSVPSSAVNVMGSPFVSTPVPYVVTPADWLAASIAQRNASILMQHAHLLQTMAQQARPGQIGYMPAPSALVNAMGSPFISTPAVMPVNATAFHALQLMQAQQLRALYAANSTALQTTQHCTQTTAATAKTHSAEPQQQWGLPQQTRGRTTICQTHSTSSPQEPP